MKKILALSIGALALVGAAPAEAGLVLFHSPSGNIGCSLAGYGARCDVDQHSWTPPPKPASCDLDWGGGVGVSRHGKADYTCAGDTTLHQGNTLAYGASVQRGRFRCKSLTSGVRCVNRRNKHGFKVSADSVELF
jgi:hypothetical protein